MRRTQKQTGNTKSRLQMCRSESIPNTRKSSVSSTTVLPEPTEPNCPIIERSSVRRCRFEKLSRQSSISRSTLSSVTITGSDQGESVSSSMVGSRNASIDGRGNNAHSAITRSALVSCSVSASSIDRSCMAHCTITNVPHISRTRASKAYIHDASHIERCSITSGVRVMDKSSLERSELRDGSVVCASTVTESTISGGSVVRNSKIENAKIEACEIVGCDIRGGKFEGMVLRGGIWKGSDLVGRREDSHEVVVMTKEEWERQKEQERREQMEEQEVGEIQIIPPASTTRVMTSIPTTPTLPRLDIPLSASSSKEPLSPSTSSEISLDDLDISSDDDDDDDDENISIIDGDRDLDPGLYFEKRPPPPPYIP